MRILVTGSRTWTDASIIVDAILSRTRGMLEADVTIVHGACPKGADALVDLISSNFDWRIERYPANWSLYGNRAGYARNYQMVALGADLCLAFIKDQSRGSTMCAHLAEQAGIKTERFNDACPDSE